MLKLFRGVVQSLIETNNQGSRPRDLQGGSRSDVAAGHPPEVVD